MNSNALCDFRPRIRSQTMRPCTHGCVAKAPPPAHPAPPPAPRSRFASLTHIVWLVSCATVCPARIFVLYACFGALDRRVTPAATHPPPRTMAPSQLVPYAATLQLPPVRRSQCDPRLFIITIEGTQPAIGERAMRCDSAYRALAESTRGARRDVTPRHAVPLCSPSRGAALSLAASTSCHPRAISRTSHGMCVRGLC